MLICNFACILGYNLLESSKEHKGDEEKNSTYSKHPGGVLDVLGVGFDISVVESATVVHINIVVSLEMVDKEWDTAADGAVSSSVRALVGTKPAILFMPQSAMIGENILTAEDLVLARHFQ